ncbi:hypothetical protein [Rickettsia endosymbiont of Gonocerus acuteangulatus]|uniref:hypothetical protein n=1 Tax=Rickettsia endosymbiont of Gonocerus acuteangulatus TaxID=3066266 RepID=UPI003132B67D
MNKIEELSKEAIEVLGFGNIAEEVDFSKDQVQKIMEFIVNKEIFTKGENIKYFWMAIDDINLIKINELKNNIDDKKYAEILITSLLLNSIIRNDKVIKFLLTETEISQYPTLKAKIIPYFLGSELNEEIIELLSIDNEAIFRKELSYLKMQGLSRTKPINFLPKFHWGFYNQKSFLACYLKSQQHCQDLFV